MKVKLNIQAIRVAEKLLNKPFGKFDLSDENTLMTLIYGSVSENNEDTFSLDLFKKILGQKKMRSLITKKFNDEMAYMYQFKGEEDGENDVYMGDLAAFLIASGMDAHFVLYEMKLFEVGDYVKAIDERKKDQMESDRLWTYFSILPHVNTKKLKEPQDLITFPWEKEAKEKDRLADLERDSEMFYKFFNSKPL